MILQANSMGGVTGDVTWLIYDIARLAPGIDSIEVTAYLRSIPRNLRHLFRLDNYPKARPNSQLIIEAEEDWISHFNTSPVASKTKMVTSHNHTLVWLGREDLCYSTRNEIVILFNPNPISRFPCDCESRNDQKLC